MEFVETIGDLIEYGIAFSVMAGMVAAFMLDRIVSGKSRDREVAREREISANYSKQVDELIAAIRESNDAWEKRNDIDEARQRFEQEHRAK